MKHHDYCPQCGNDVDDLIIDLGICEYCAETPKQRNARIKSEMLDAYENGRPESDHYPVSIFD